MTPVGASLAVWRSLAAVWRARPEVCVSGGPLKGRHTSLPIALSIIKEERQSGAAMSASVRAPAVQPDATEPATEPATVDAPHLPRGAVEGDPLDGFAAFTVAVRARLNARPIVVHTPDGACT